MTLGPDPRYARSLALVLAALWGIAGSGPGGRAAVEAQMSAPPPAEQPAAEPRVSRASPNPASGKAEAIEAGHKLYFMWCVQCHGPKADGVARFGKYAGDLRAFWRGYGEFVTTVKNGRPERQMPPWKEVLNDTQIAQLAAYLETLAVEGANWK
jgi:polar amino acid transport system substrate-binding protein